MKKDLTINTKEAKNFLVDVEINVISKKIKDRLTGSGITLTNNEIKYIINVIRSLENRGILLNGATKKLIVKKEEFLIFLDH